MDKTECRKNVEEYRKMILSKKYTPKSIMKKIEMPTSIYKYRCFYRYENGIKKEDPYWKESMAGKNFFSLAKEFNRNDEFDCKIYYKESKIGFIDEFMQKYTKNIRDNFRIGCFTKCSVEENYMWQQKDFGGAHTGFCIEYKVEKEMFYPGTIIFLPVLYEKENYDMTGVFSHLINNVEKLNNPEKQYEVLASIIPVCYNFALIKKKEYLNEQEWRILVTQNRYDDYFTDKEYIRDFSAAMKAIYLGCEYKKIEKYNEKYDYAMKICQKRRIPLYEMCKVDGSSKLEKVLLYSPN